MSPGPFPCKRTPSIFPARPAVLCPHPEAWLGGRAHSSLGWLSGISGLRKGTPTGGKGGAYWDAPPASKPELFPYSNGTKANCSRETEQARTDQGRNWVPGILRPASASQHPQI